MRRLARAAFWMYAALVFTATHWPNLRIESGVVERPDLYIHMTVFGLWTLLLVATGYFADGAEDPVAESGGVRGWARIVTRPLGVVKVGVVALVYAAADEMSQGIPGLGRTVAWDDYAANSAGIVSAVAAALIAWRTTRRGGR